MDVTSYLLGKKAGGGTPAVLEDKEVTITQNGETTITPSTGYTGMSSVDLTVNVPQPSGKIEITQNGTDIDVSSYATADVSVPSQKFTFVNGGGFSFQGDTRNNLQPEIDNIVANVDMSGITTMQSMFSGCKNITSIDLSDLDVSNVKTTTYMFSGCTNLSSIDFDNWNTSNLESTKYMFNQCQGITSLSLFNNLSSLIDASGMFSGSNLTSIDLSDWTTSSSLTNVGSMFASCTNITSVDLSGWDVTGITTTNSMLYGCTNLTSIDLSGWNTSSLENTGYMFHQCTRLTRIDMRDFNFSNVTASTGYTSMFGTSSSNGPANNCLIIVKDNTQKQWITSRFSRLTNVKTVAEIGG